MRKGKNLLNDGTRDEVLSALNKLSEANTAMAVAIERCVDELVENTDRNIIFKNEIDCSSTDPITGLYYDNGVVVETDYDEMALDDLTANELFEICNNLIAGNYFLEGTNDEEE